MSEDYCSFELSKLLKEKGFDWDCRCYYFSENNERCYSNEIPRNNHKLDADLACPTHQMAMKWMREVHNIHIAIDRGIEHYFAVLTKLKPYQDLTMKNDVFDTYEEAVEAAIKYSLENLI